jgi:hypothetical protein
MPHTSKNEPFYGLTLLIGGIGVERFLQAAAIAVWFEKPHELLMGPGLRVGMLDAIQIIKC